MTDQELRLECLRLALQDADKFTETESTISKATTFYRFASGAHELPQDNQDTAQEQTDGFCRSLLVVSFPRPTKEDQELLALLSRLQG